MKRTSLVVAVLVFVSVLFVGLSFIPEVRATTRYVGGAGPGNYTTIQDAVDNASLGDTVFVYGGTYRENVIINRTLTLIGEDRNTTVIDGNASGDAVHVTADRVNISGFTITNSGDMNGRAGIEINRSHDCRVTGNSITDNNDGLYVLNSNYTSITNNSFSLNANNSITVYASHNSMLVSNTIFRRDASLRFSDGSVILNNSFSNNGYGIDLMNTSNSTVSGNTFMANNGGIYAAYSRDTVMASNTFTYRTGKIYLSWSGNMTLVNNDFAQGGILLWGENMADHNTHTIMGNQVGGLPIHYYKDCDGVMVDGIPIGQLFMANCSNVRASNLDFFNVTVGIEMAFVDGGLIENVSVAGARFGIFLHQSNNNVTIANSNISGNWGDGIIVRSSTNNTILNTTTSFNSLGVWLYESMASTVESNIACSNTRGILSSSSGHDTIRNNTVIGNHFGLHIGGSSHNSTVAGNNVSESTDRGIILTFTRDNVVANNTAFSNKGGAIYVDDSVHNLIANNTGMKGPFVVSLTDSSFITVIGNTAIDSEGDGIELIDSHNNTVKDNTVRNNEYGITLYVSDNNTVANNNVSWSGQLGIQLGSSSGNRIYHNNFLNNTEQAEDDGAANAWDDGYPSGGNHWSDYAGFDNKSGPNQDQPGSDGLGDTPYPIQVGNEDRYPLMSPSGTIRHRPPKITSTTLSGKDMENITLTWSLSPDDGTGLESITGYAVYRNSTYDSTGLGYQFIAFLPNGTSAFVDSFTGNGDPSGYFYRVCALDANNSTACDNAQAGKFTSPLAQGPGLVSIPLIQSDESIGTVLQTVEYDKAWLFDSSSQEWKWYMKNKEYRRGLWNMNHTMGVWVNVTRDSNLTVAGVVPVPTTIHLYEGWNLVSFPSFSTSYSVAVLKVEIGVTRVEGYDSSPPHHLRVLGDGEILQAGYGYWVKVQADVEWIITFD